MAKEPKQLDELFHDTLKDIYFAEKKILSALPKMAKAAHNADLKAAFEKHESETGGQIERREQAFELIGAKEKEPVQFHVELLENQQSRDRAPRAGNIVVTCPPAAFEQMMWDV